MFAFTVSCTLLSQWTQASMCMLIRDAILLVTESAPSVEEEEEEEEEDEEQQQQ